MERLRGTRRGSKVVVRLAGVTGLLGLSGWVVAGTAAPAFADSAAYELYCPGTPVGTIVLNDVVTTGTLTPASPASGQAFTITNYQTKVTIPYSIASAAAALGNTAIMGTATGKLDAVSGATPSSVTGSALSFNQPLPTPVPQSGIQLLVPATPGTVSGFTASGGQVSIAQDSATSLTLTVSGAPLTLTCTAYPNNSSTTGIGGAKPSAATISPVIATSSAGGSATTSPPTTAATAATTATTAPPTAASGGTLATTGAGPGVTLLAELGAGGLVAAGLLAAGYRSRLLLAAAGRTKRRHDTK